MNRPFLLFQIEILRKAGIADITLSLSYQPDKIEQILGDGSEYGVRLRYLTEPNPLGTGGAYRFASDDLNDTTIVLNGDILTDADLGKIVDFHLSNKAEATIALTPVDDPSRYGLVEADKQHRVKAFVEKPEQGAKSKTKRSNINAGIYILEPTVRDLITRNENRSFEYQVFPDLLGQGRPFFAYELGESYWRDLGNPESYLAAHMDLLKGGLLGLETPKADLGDVATHSHIERSLIGENCTIKPNVEIINSVIGDGAHIEEKARIENSVVWSHTRVASSATVNGAVVARTCHIGRNSTLSPGTVLGDKASIPDYSRL